MSLDMDLRARTEDQTAISYTSGQNHSYELTRIRGGLELRPSPWLTGYIQFHDAHALSLPSKYTASNMRDSFDLRQGYVQLRYKPILFLAGRQELRFGDERVVGISNWTNDSRTWDGFDLRIGNKNRVDFFSSSVVTVAPTSLDRHGAGLTFHGVEGTFTTLLRNSTINPFILVRGVRRVVSQQGIAGAELEITPGIYVSGKLPFNFDYSATTAIQRGSYSNNSIRSGAAILKAGYATNRLPWNPHLQGEYDYATGNSHSNLQQISTYDQQYPSNHNAFGLVDLFGFQNIRQLRANLDLRPAPYLSVLVQTGSLHLATVNDNLYGSSGSTLIKAPTKGFANDGIGTEFDVSGKYVYHKYFVVNVGAGHFFPGSVMTHNAHGAPLTLAYLSFTYRFKVSGRESDSVPLMSRALNPANEVRPKSGQHVRLARRSTMEEPSER
jgi:hypothetical protein